MMVELKQILNDLAAHLESLREDGVTAVEVSREVLRAMAPPAGGRAGASGGPASRLSFHPAPGSLPARPAGESSGGERKAVSRPDAARGSGQAGDGRPARPGGQTTPELDAIAKRVAGCTRCALHGGRTRTVPGQGNPHPEILFVGEGPGEDEDIQGLAFVGRAGQLLTKMIEAMGYRRDEVFIANIVKCRPPGNRKPFPDEMAACLPYLKEQIALLKPRVIIALGATAVTGLLGSMATGISRLRGNWQSFGGIDVMPTFHPSYLLRTPSAKNAAWADLQAVLKKLGRPVPAPGKR
jgi:DNA polymerase